MFAQACLEKPPRLQRKENLATSTQCECQGNVQIIHNSNHEKGLGLVAWRPIGTPLASSRVIPSESRPGM
jgi:hypothetical protein